jgi:hypothetical protein
MTRRLLLLVAILVLAGRAALATDIFSCGATVTAGDTGVLQNDMSCGGAFVGVHVADQGTVDMNGHLIKDVGSGGSAIKCEGRHCTVRGPGEITGGAFGGVEVALNTRLAINDVNIHGVDGGIFATGVGSGPPPTSTVTATNVSLSNNVNGTLFVGTIKGSNIDASNNSNLGLDFSRRLVATTVTTNDNARAGVFGGRVRVTGLTSNGNGDAGVRSVSARLTDSTLTGNNGFGIGVDLATVHRPRVTNVTCVKSGKIGGSGNWGVCSGD